MTLTEYHSICDHLRRIIRGTEWEGHVFAVGGCCRDEVMGREINDVDLAVDLQDGGVRFARWLDRHGRCASRPVYFERYGTAMLQLRAFRDHEIEIVQTRKGKYTADNAHNPGSVFGTIEDDGLRRDLTVNALFYDLTRRALLDKAYQNVKRLASLLSDLSVITRISDAPDQIQLAPVDVTSVIKRVADDMKVFPPSQQMRIHINVTDDVKINGNQSLVESIFRNLFTNAFNYSGGRDVTVDLTDETSDYYTFSFADNGIGVPPEHLNRIFERFYRVDTGRSRALGGTGLGLSIVKNAVLFHKGQISVENQYNGGLKFTFSLHK